MTYSLRTQASQIATERLVALHRDEYLKILRCIKKDLSEFYPDPKQLYNKSRTRTLTRLRMYYREEYKELRDQALKEGYPARYKKA